MQNKIVYVDVDDTVALTRSAIVQYYRMKTGDYSTSPYNRTGMKYDKLCPQWTGEQMRYAFMDPAFFSLLRPIPGAKLGIEYLIEKGYDVQICTAHRVEGRGYKLHWIREHFPRIDPKKIIMTEPFVPKDDYVGYAFIDDHIHNVENNKSEIKVLFDNYGIIEYNNDVVKRITNWNKIKEVL